ncbi:hypothetical protein NA57DRAFT_70058 [Rhizodiscina lignyota]|uniref:Metallo-beta-lactamase domain-containing protein n=1 Tax=Rhizodiscina lignyota TaxID=1504668 RepID=A0A9P4ILQ6_9PEZI|nr:hypothetical protein NA57DRAFT_70058 [Rhizodiscina lignyota]
MAPPTTSFTTSRINGSTFLIVETDDYGEWPFIYAKQHPTEPILILSDTGCNAPRDKSVKLSNLREYLETYPIFENGGRPLNPIVKSNDGKGSCEREYVVICSHCHYDHIGCIEAFSTTTAQNTTKSFIVASSHDPDFILKDLPTHSLCRFKDPPIETPKYSITHWAHDYGKLYADPEQGIYVRGKLPKIQDVSHLKSLGITFLHTPGHTPDSLAWWDEDERWLYVGDSFYERQKEDMPIIFPAEGNLLHFFHSMQHLLIFVRSENAAEERRTAERERESKHDFEVLSRRIKVGCAHQTAGEDAEEMIMATLRLIMAIVAGKVPVISSKMQRGEPVDLWRESKKARFSVLGPRRLIEDVRDEIERCKREKRPIPLDFNKSVEDIAVPQKLCGPTCQGRVRQERRLNAPRFVMYSSSTTAISLPGPFAADPR